MQSHRENLVASADKYYRFFNRIVDIKATDGDEVFVIKDTTGNNLLVSVFKRAKQGYTGYPIYSKIFDHTITHELRIYAGKGNDSISVDNQSALIQVRVIGGKGQKSYNVISAANKRTAIYDKRSSTTVTGPAASKLRTHFSDDSLTVGYIPVNLFNNTLPLFSSGYNKDDGIWAMGGVRFIVNGFRKEPVQIQTFTFMHGFGNNTNRLNYTGEWMNAVKRADVEVNANIYTPNVINFFGKGNNTPLIKNGDYQNYYRTRFDLVGLDLNARFHNKTSSTTLRIGPTFQYYHFEEDNINHLIYNQSLSHNYDSATFNKDKLHVGLNLIFINDKRDNPALPNYGLYISLKVQNMVGINSYSRGFSQFVPEVRLYKSVTTNSSFVIEEKIGGGFTIGKPAFYQLLFLGGPDNLAGFRQYRFAGSKSLYNTLGARYKLNVLAPYILPGQYGVIANYGIGRVWANSVSSKTWHNSVSGGFYFAPADMAILQIQTGYSKDGWYPFVTLKLNI